MKIAIVDDDRDELSAAETYLRDYLRKNWTEDEPNIQIDTFSCAKDLLKIFKPGMYQLVVLDIRMPEINGMQTAQVIRARGDNEVNIVFLTCSDDYILNGYRVFAVGYFMKPITNRADEFAKTFKHIFPKFCKKNPELVLNADGKEISVPHGDIFYVDIEDGRKFCVHLADKKIVTTNNYVEIADILLQDERFLESYHRIILNMDYVKLMKEDDFVLINDVSVPISKRKKKEVKVKYMRYFARK